MTANTGGKGHMDGKSLFEKVQTMLREGASVIADKAPEPQRTTSEQWISAWRDFNQTINGLMKEDPRRQRIDNLLSLSDSAFERGDWYSFNRIHEQIKEILDP